MRRLDWIIDPDGSLNAWRDGWHYEIIPHNDSASEDCSQWFELTCSTDNCENIRCFSARYLDDAMALATAMAAGIKIK